MLSVDFTEILGWGLDIIRRGLDVRAYTAIVIDQIPRLWLLLKYQAIDLMHIHNDSAVGLELLYLWD